MPAELDAVFSSYEGKQDELIPVLQDVQEKFGYLSEEAMLEVAQFTRTPESAVYAVATFYAQFRFTPRGRKHIAVCRGTACHVQGAPRILTAIEQQVGIKEEETSEDLEYSLETVACIGCCALAPCITVNEEVHGRLDSKKVAKIFGDRHRTDGDDHDG